MKINQLFFICLFFCLSTQESCRNKECSCDNSYKKIPEDVKSWFWFGIGSQWIYQLKEDTTIRDTITLVARGDHESNKFCDNDVSIAEGCSEILTSILQHSNARFFPKTLVDTVHPGEETIIAYTPHGGGEFISFQRTNCSGSILGFPIDLNGYYGRYTLKDTLGVYYLRNKSYSNTIHSVGIGNDGTPEACEVWWAKGIGLLKISNHVSQETWELIQYEIK